MMEIPPELDFSGRKIKLAIDVVFINKESFLHSVDRTLHFNGFVVLGKRTKGESFTSEVSCKGLDNI